MKILDQNWPIIDKNWKIGAQQIHLVKFYRIVSVRTFIIDTEFQKIDQYLFNLQYNQFTIYDEDLTYCELEIEFKNISVIYIDPPYRKYNLTKLLNNLINKINKDTLITLEASEKDNIEIPKNLNLFQKKTYGKTTIYFLKLS